MIFLLIPVIGPMQSWGTRSRFRERDTEREPTKSGIVGMLCNALGRQRDESLNEFSTMDMGVRVDREGFVRRDFQTAEHVLRASGSVAGDPQTSYRYYLTDAAFLVGLSGEASFLRKLHRALAAPKHPLFLGRKSYVPSAPPYLPDGLVEAVDMREALLRRVPLLWTGGPDSREQIRLVLPDDGAAGEFRADDPVSFSIHDRQYRVRAVRTLYVDRSEVCAEDSNVS